MVKPLTTRHIGQAVGLGGICGADFLGQQTEEDGCHFCAGDVAVRLNVAVRVADNVRKVIVTGSDRSVHHPECQRSVCCCRRHRRTICGSIHRSA